MVRPSTLRFSCPFALPAFAFADLESDPLPRLFWRRHKLPDRLKYRLGILIMILQPHLNLLESLRQLILRGGYFSELYEGPHERDVDVNGSIHFQDG